MAVEIITSFMQQADANGVPYSGAKIYVYDVGTTTLKSVYSNVALSSAAANPIICDSSGRHDMRYIATGSYKIVVKTSADATVYTRDNIDGRVPVGSGALAIANGGTGATTAATALTALGGATSAEVSDLSEQVAEIAGSLASSSHTHLATGTTAQRPAAPIAGDVRRNSTTSKYEGYTTGWESFLLSGDIATQAQMEAGSSTAVVVTPGRMKNHDGVAKAWAYVRYIAGAPTLTASHNCSSVTDNADGDATVVFTTALSSANYCAVVSIDNSDGAGTGDIETAHVRTKAAGSVRVATSKSDAAGDRVAANIDFNLIVFGDF